MAPLKNSKAEAAALARANGETIKSAYESAGFKYQKGNAHRLFNRQDVRDRIQELIADRADAERDLRKKALEEAQVDKPFIAKHLKINGLMAMRGDPVYWRDKVTGQPFIAYYRPDRHAANKAFELLGKMEGVFIERLELGGPGDFASLSDDDLNQKIAEIVRALGVPEKEAVKLLQYLGPTPTQEAAE